MPIRAYILIQTEVGRASDVAGQIRNISGVISADVLTSPYDIIAHTEADDVDELGRMVVSKVQMIEGITRTTTCPVVNI
ncbi:MAG: Lrp/AsnC ligand binding domain-containing protein [Acidimicrobiia bacterium]|nr:Lrp/AsnC ligand binding domain-containing protein [Acidimicrobiia bacterium]